MSYFLAKSFLLTIFQESLRKGRRNAEKSFAPATLLRGKIMNLCCSAGTKQQQQPLDVKIGKLQQQQQQLGCEGNGKSGRSCHGTLGKSVLRHEYPSARITDTKTSIPSVQASYYTKRHKYSSTTKISYIELLSR